MDLHLPRVALVGAAALALLVSATGGAVADRLITSADIRDHTIKREDLATGSIAGRVVKNGGIRDVDLADGAVDGRALRDGSVTRAELAPGLKRRLAKAGGRGATGPAGAAGAPGAPGVSGYEIVTHDVTGTSGTIGEADCPAGKSVIGGSYEPITAGVNYARPKSDGTGWLAQIAIAGPGTGTVRVYAICATVAS